MAEKHTFYFIIQHGSCTELTLSEYLATVSGTELVYYRKPKDKCLPGVREAKVKAENVQLLRRIRNYILDTYGTEIENAREELRKFNEFWSEYL